SSSFSQLLSVQLSHPHLVSISSAGRLEAAVAIEMFNEEKSFYWPSCYERGLRRVILAAGWLHKRHCIRL
ncbi:hypothetical protein ACGYK6_17265, partial [Sulfitobacter sp. 1A15333]|uniref:hypothetical protein n=1 Tax=unclassified Sulfitobacter TaxID=196795 RepID=UPI0037466125